MFQEKSDNTYTASVKQTEKRNSKEKTLATAHQTQQGQLDVTKPVKESDIALIEQDSEKESVFYYPDSIWDYYPGKYQKHTNINPPLQNDITYQVKKGESIGTIAKKYGVTKDALVAANKDKIHGKGKALYFYENEIISIPEITKTTNKETSLKEITVDDVKNYYQKYNNIDDLGKYLAKYAISNPDLVKEAYNLVTNSKTDNLTVAIMTNLSDSEIDKLAGDLREHFYNSLDNGWIGDEEYALIEKLKAGKEPNRKEKEKVKDKEDIKTDVEKDLKTVRGIITYRLQGSVGGKNKKDEDNFSEDIKQVALRLKQRKYAISDSAIKNGTWDKQLCDSIGEFQKDINKDKKGFTPDYVIDPGYGTYKALFDVNKYNSGLDEIFGKSDSKLNEKLDKEDTKFLRLNRDLTYDSKTKKNIGSFDESKTVSREDYNKSVEKIGEKIGIKEKSGETKILDIVDKAVANEKYFNELTKNVTTELELSDKSIGSNSVNPILEKRLTRYHKLMVAIGLFTGKMTGSACRLEADAHRWSIYYYWKTGKTHINSIKDNLVKMYNKELKPNGKVCVDKDGNVKDLDDFIWAKKDYFVLDKNGKATSLNSKWDDYMEIISSKERVTKNDNGEIVKDWRLVSAAEGYDYGDNSRFPMPLNNGKSRSKHITGDAIDINYGNFTRMNDAMNDLIALRFGLIRPVSKEQWHFEITNIAFSEAEKI